jgi:phosphonate transport system substrate-binding protein
MRGWQQTVTGVLVTGMLVAFGSAAAGCGEDDDRSTSASSAAALPSTLRLGVVATGTADEVRKQWSRTASDLKRRLGGGTDVELVASTDYFAITEGMRQGDLDVAAVGSLAYVLGRQRARMEPVAVGVDASGRTGYHSLLITNEPDVRSPSDLRGRSVALSNKLSTSGYLFPLGALRDAGLELGDLKVTQGGNHAANVLAVKQGSVDAAFVDSTEYELAVDRGTIDAQQVREVWRSTRITGSPFVVRGDLPVQVRDRIKGALLALRGTDEFPLGLEQTPRLQPVADRAYDPIRQLAERAGISIADFREE